MNKERWQNRGLTLLSEGKHREALSALEKAIELDPNLVAAWSGRGDALRILGRRQEALRAYDRARELDSKHAPAWHGRGMVLCELEKYERALEAFERAQALDPEPVLPLYGKGIALRALNRYEEALNAFNQAIDLSPSFANAWQGRGNVLRDFGKHAEALEAYKKALELDRENGPIWYSKGSLLRDELDYPSQARRAFLRVVYLAEHATSPQYRQLAANSIPSILSYFHESASAPLLVISLLERHELLDAYLGKPRVARRAFERAAPYRLLKHYFVPPQASDPEKCRKHSLLGLAAFYLGDPFLAQEHFDRLDTMDDEDLFGSYYYARTYQEYAKDEATDTIIDVSRDHARKVLQQARRGGEVALRQLYYAGQLFATGSDPELPLARRCFELAAGRGFLPAMYMHAWILRELEGEGNVHDVAVKSVLAEERRRVKGDTQETESFLRGQLPEFSGSPQKDLLEAETIPEEEMSAAVDAIEQLLWHRAHQAEIIDAIRDVRGWLGRKEKQEEAQEYEDLLKFRDRSPELDEWIANRQHVEILQRRLEEQAAELDLPVLREELQGRTFIPEGWLDSVETEPKELEEWLGRKIFEDEDGTRYVTYQELILYLALNDQIMGRQALALSAYLLATNPNTIGEFGGQEAAEATVSALLGTGGSKLLQAAGVRITLLTGLSLGVASSVVAFFIAKRVKESVEQRIEYPAFREEFDKALEGQPGDTYRMIEDVLDTIESRQSSAAT